MSENLDISLYNFNDEGNGQIIASMFGDVLRFDHKLQKWFIWDEHFWRVDDLNEVARYAVKAARKRFIESINIEDKSLRRKSSTWAINSENQRIIKSSLISASTLDPIRTNGKNWNKNKLLIACKNGVIDLKNGTLRNGLPEDNITLSLNVTYDESAGCELWEKFLQDIFMGDDELIHWIQKALGYSLTGDISEQAMFFCYGTGANGKSVMFSTLLHLFGDYSYTLASHTIKKSHMVRENMGDVAGMEHKRFATSGETLSAAKLDEERLKKWTGGDEERARFMYAESSVFTPVCKVWLFFNHKPMIDDDSYGFWRRVRLIPFNRTFKPEEMDDKLADKLRAESSGILNWLIEGCLMWQKEGLKDVPQIINQATDEYEKENDPLEQFVLESCETGTEMQAISSILYNAYKTWASLRGFKEKEILTNTMFGRRMSNKFKKIRTMTQIVYIGIQIKSQNSEWWADENPTLEH